jgi:hypothetical protein
MDIAFDFLKLGRRRGLNNDLQQKAMERAFEERNSSRLLTLVARVEAKIRNHVAASFCASSAPLVSAAIAPAASSEPAFQTHVQTHNPNLSLTTFASVGNWTRNTLGHLR